MEVTFVLALSVPLVYLAGYVHGHRDGAARMIARLVRVRVPIS